MIFFTLITATLAQSSCNTQLYSSVGQTCLGYCTPLTDPCQRAQCFVSCANVEGNSACLTTSTTTCEAVSNCACNDVPEFNANGPITGTVSTFNNANAIEFGCDSVAQSNEFSACLTLADSPCALLTSSPPSDSFALQQLQCQCAFQTQTCQANNNPCLDTQYGTTNYFETSCLAQCTSPSLIEAFHACCTAPGTACVTDSTSCGCAQQVQVCQQKNYPCQNIGLGTTTYLQQSCSTCSNENLLTAFHACCQAPDSACATINANYQYGYSSAPQTLACNCSVQVQQCQQANAGCQNAAQGAASIISNSCSSCSNQANTIGFQNCVNLPGSSCAQVELNYPFGGAPTSLLCQCAQQVQTCQSATGAWSGCQNSDWGTQTFLNNVCGGAQTTTVATAYSSYNGQCYNAHTNSYYKCGASTTALSVLLALAVIVVAML